MAQYLKDSIPSSSGNLQIGSMTSFCFPNSINETENCTSFIPFDDVIGLPFPLNTHPALKYFLLVLTIVVLVQGTRLRLKIIAADHFAGLTKTLGKKLRVRSFNLGKSIIFTFLAFFRIFGGSSYFHQDHILGITYSYFFPTRTRVLLMVQCSSSVQRWRWFSFELLYSSL